MVLLHQAVRDEGGSSVFMIVLAGPDLMSVIIQPSSKGRSTTVAAQLNNKTSKKHPRLYIPLRSYSRGTRVMSMVI